MPLYTKKEFAGMCGMSTATLSTYASPARKKVVYTNDYIDSSIEPNISFLSKWSARKTEKLPENVAPPLPAAVKKELRLTRPPRLEEMQPEKPPKNRQRLDEEDDEGPGENEFAGMDAKKVATQIRKMEKEIEKLTLSNQKTRGQVVPIDPINSLFLQDRQSVLIEMKHGLEDILAIFSKRRDLSEFERTEVRAEFTDRLNEAMKRAATMTSASVEAIVGEYSIKRGKGERD